jgi:GNAT superfamily N-acetyltransferase
MAGENGGRGMTVRFEPLRLADAWVIGGWRYDPPYDAYNLDRLNLVMMVLMKRSYARLGQEHYGVWSDGGDLVGLFSFARAGKEGITVGLALRPDLAGKGNGLAFMQAGLAFARRRYAPKFFQLTVAEFNQRAIKVYERAGFTLGKKTYQWTARPERRDRFEMRRDA